MSAPAVERPRVQLALNPYLTENPEKISASLRIKAFAANTLAKIASVAITAICATVLAVSLFGTPAGIVSYILLGLVFTTVFLGVAIPKLLALAQKYSHSAEIEARVAQELKRIESWNTDDIKQFFQKHKLPMDRLPIEDLDHLNPNEPLRALLPLIARYEYYHKRAFESWERYKVNLASKSNDLDLSITAKKEAYKLREIAIPAVLDAALMLRIICQPALQIRLNDLGHIKDSTERTYDRLLLNNDDYFLFNDPKQAPLTLRELEQNFDPDALQLRLFA